jgi:hypothetical protein
MGREAVRPEPVCYVVDSFASIDDGNLVRRVAGCSIKRISEWEPSQYPASTNAFIPAAGSGGSAMRIYFTTRPS